MKTVHLLYFAQLRDLSACSSETILTDAETILELYQECSDRHHFTLPAKIIRAAIDQTYISLDSSFPDQSTIAFIPPVSGG